MPVNEFTNLPLFENPPQAARVRALMCSDSKGQVQIVAPEVALVDPEPIRSTTARDLNIVPGNPATPICAVPGYYGMPSVVHSNLKIQNDMALASEEPGKYFRASGKQIRDMCSSHASFETRFCETLTPTPADSTQDEDTILAAVDTFTARRIEARLDETLHIPPLPEAAQRIITLQQNPYCDLSDLVAIVETDPAIAARIMGWANSALYGLETPVKTLNEAIMRVLGFDLVFNMALGLAIGETLRLPTHHVSGANAYWLDAVYCAATMEALAHQIPRASRPNPGLAYLIGLLSNFGTLVVGHVFPPQYETICRMQEANPQLSHTYVDNHVLAVNREVIAATLLEQWELPEELTTALRFQFVNDYVGEHTTYVNLLALAREIVALDGAPLTPDLESQAQTLQVEAAGLGEVLGVLAGSQDDLSQLSTKMAQ